MEDGYEEQNLIQELSWKSISGNYLNLVVVAKFCQPLKLVV